jgi:Na+-transporting NADH:ubiquinone oxidoreductase subunit NqrE
MGGRTSARKIFAALREYHANASRCAAKPSVHPRGKVMTWWVGVLTLAGTVVSVALGQVAAGAEALGVVIAAATLMTVRA